jgi:hypothetical protein
MMYRALVVFAVIAVATAFAPAPTRFACRSQLKIQATREFPQAEKSWWQSVLDYFANALPTVMVSP